MERLILECGQVQRDFISFYLSAKETTESSPFRVYEGRDSYFVLGVRDPVNPGS